MATKGKSVENIIEDFINSFNETMDSCSKELELTEGDNHAEILFNNDKETFISELIFYMENESQEVIDKVKAFVNKLDSI